MNDGKPDGFMMIGLHKLAAQNGEGLIPELHALLMADSRLRADNRNVTEFPVREARPPARQVPFEAIGAPSPRATDNVLAFPQRSERPRLLNGSRQVADS